MELEALLTKLKMEHLEAQLDTVCEQAASRQEDYKTFLTQALQTEWQGRGTNAASKLAYARLASPGSRPLSSSTSTFNPVSTAARCAN